MIRLILADDHKMFREGVARLLAEADGLQLVGEAADGDEALKLAEAAAPDLALIDLTMPGPGAAAIIDALAKQAPPVRTIILTMHNEAPVAVQMVRAGAKGFVLKDAAFQELLDAIDQVTAGGSYMSPSLGASLAARGADQPTTPALSGREQEVLKMIAAGDTNRRIASRLGVSVKTVETHRANLMQKLGVRGAAELVRVAVEQGVLPIRPHQ